MVRRKVSNVWSFFIRNNEKSTAKCNTCKREYKTSGNTSNLMDHINRFHPELKSTTSKSGDEDSPTGSITSHVRSSSGHQTIKTLFQKQTSYDNNSYRKKELDKALIFMISKDYQPFSIVEDVGFKHFVKLLDPKYDLPSRKLLSNDFLKYHYQEVRDKLFTLLEKVSDVSLTCDLWSSRANESYLTITCHFIDENFNIRCSVLSTNKMTNNHTANNIAAEIDTICNDWKLNNKICSIITDNASSMVNACDILKVQHYPCFAHTLNLVVQDALKLDNIQEVIKKCKDIVTFFKCSNVATQKLLDEQIVLNKTPLKLIQSCPTRRNSILFMIKRVLQINSELTVALSKMPKAPAALNLEDTLILQDLIQILNIFDEATNKISGNYVTTSFIIPLVCGI